MMAKTMMVGTVKLCQGGVQDIALGSWHYLLRVATAIMARFRSVECVGFGSEGGVDGGTEDDHGSDPWCGLAKLWRMQLGRAGAPLANGSRVASSWGHAGHGGCGRARWRGCPDLLSWQKAVVDDVC